MIAEPKPIQFFLDDEGVHTVSVMPNGGALTCTCPDDRCAHLQWANERRRQHALPELLYTTPSSKLSEAVGMSAEDFRKFLLRYSKIIAL